MSKKEAPESVELHWSFPTTYHVRIRKMRHTWSVSRSFGEIKILKHMKPSEASQFHPVWAASSSWAPGRSQRSKTAVHQIWTDIFPKKKNRKISCTGGPKKTVPWFLFSDPISSTRAFAHVFLFGASNAFSAITAVGPPKTSLIFGTQLGGWKAERSTNIKVGNMFFGPTNSYKEETNPIDYRL